ncbi:FAD:protein FMN transferase [Streptomyces sp. CB03234]|uniref:FAD:protein FMN transferase n=1 Tax=Streptomyces sp. (strain CB03234) TaxID=1703937 RepID=UPI0009393D9B
MGSTGHLLVAGDPELLTRARARLEQMESLWSRFRADSELCRLNASQSGRWVQLSPPTVALLRRAVRAWEVTGGLFDPTVLPALETAGYTRSFAELPQEIPYADDSGPAPGCADRQVPHQAPVPGGCGGGRGQPRNGPGVAVPLTTSSTPSAAPRPTARWPPSPSWPARRAVPEVLAKAALIAGLHAGQALLGPMASPACS